MRYDHYKNKMKQVVEKSLPPEHKYGWTMMMPVSMKNLTRDDSNFYVFQMLLQEGFRHFLTDVFARAYLFGYNHERIGSYANKLSDQKGWKAADPQQQLYEGFADKYREQFHKKLTAWQHGKTSFQELYRNQCNDDQIGIRATGGGWLGWGWVYCVGVGDNEKRLLDAAAETAWTMVWVPRIRSAKPEAEPNHSKHCVVGFFEGRSPQEITFRDGEEAKWIPKKDSLVYLRLAFLRQEGVMRALKEKGLFENNNGNAGEAKELSVTEEKLYRGTLQNLHERQQCTPNEIEFRSFDLEIGEHLKTLYCLDLAAFADLRNLVYFYTRLSRVKSVATRAFWGTDDSAKKLDAWRGIIGEVKVTSRQQDSGTAPLIKRPHVQSSDDLSPDKVKERLRIVEEISVWPLAQVKEAAFPDSQEVKTLNESGPMKTLENVLSTSYCNLVEYSLTSVWITVSWLPTRRHAADVQSVPKQRKLVGFLENSAPSQIRWVGCDGSNVIDESLPDHVQGFLWQEGVQLALMRTLKGNGIKGTAENEDWGSLSFEQKEYYRHAFENLNTQKVPGSCKPVDIGVRLHTQPDESNSPSAEPVPLFCLSINTLYMFREVQGVAGSPDQQLTSIRSLFLPNAQPFSPSDSSPDDHVEALFLLAMRAVATRVLLMVMEGQAGIPQVDTAASDSVVGNPAQELSESAKIHMERLLQAREMAAVLNSVKTMATQAMSDPDDIDRDTSPELWRVTVLGSIRERVQLYLSPEMRAPDAECLKAAHDRPGVEEKIDRVIVIADSVLRIEIPAGLKRISAESPEPSDAMQKLEQVLSKSLVSIFCVSIVVRLPTSQGFLANREE